MQILDNVNTTVRDDLKANMKKGSRVSIAAACFSIYAYKELKKQLSDVEEDSSTPKEDKKGKAVESADGVEWGTEKGEEGIGRIIKWIKNR